VIGVTTHSKLIGKFLKTKCNLKEKIFNNGVLHMEYNFHAREDSAYRIGQYELEEIETSIGSRCNILHTGLHLHDEQGELKDMCVADVGKTCMSEIAAYAYLGSRMKTLTTEHKIYELAKRMARNEQELKKLQTSLEAKLEVYQLTYSSDTDHARGALQEAKVLRKSIDELYESLEDDLVKIQTLKKKPCWRGGSPDVEGYWREHEATRALPTGTEKWWQELNPRLPERVTAELLDYIEQGNQLHAPCLVVHHTESSSMASFFKAGHSDVESTCHGGLRCYVKYPTVAGQKPMAGEEGICAIPRTKTCDAGATQVDQGCRPLSRCVKGRFSSTCENYREPYSAQELG